MQLSFTEKKNVRKDFGTLKETLSIPNLIEVQKQSYAQFLSSKNTSGSNSSIGGSEQSAGLSSDGGS